MYISIGMRLHLISINSQLQNDTKFQIVQINDIITYLIDKVGIQKFIYIDMIINGTKIENVIDCGVEMITNTII